MGTEHWWKLKGKPEVLGEQPVCPNTTSPPPPQLYTATGQGLNPCSGSSDMLTTNNPTHSTAPLEQESCLGHYTVRPAITILCSELHQNNCNHNTSLQCTFHWFCKSQLHGQMWGSHSNVAEDSSFLRCHAGSLGETLDILKTLQCFKLSDNTHPTMHVSRTSIFCIQNVTK
jgi:hypothetical protein